MGGGRFFPFPAPVVAGAARVGIGSGSFGVTDGETSSWRALKLRFLRIGVGVVILTDPSEIQQDQFETVPQSPTGKSDDANGGEGTLNETFLKVHIT